MPRVSLKRNRIIYAVAVLAVIALGLASRRWPEVLPAVLGKYPGDALWALMIFYGVGWWFSGWSSNRVGLMALAICSAVECLQLYQAPWLDAVRATLPGRLILGRGFSGNDLAAYGVGIFIGWVLERWWIKVLAQQSSTD